MFSRRNHFAALLALIACVAAFAAAADQAASATIYQPQATLSRAVNPSGEACKPNEFAGGVCRDDAEEKKSGSKSKGKKKSPSGSGSSGSSDSNSSAGDTSATNSQNNGAVSGVLGSDTNWLKTNGMSSPICSKANVTKIKALSRNCSRSGMASVPTPAGNLGFDVHIDTGITKLGNVFAQTMHNLMNFFWGQMVSITAAMFGALEWGFSLNILDGTTLGSVGQQLTSIEDAWTSPVARMLMACFGVWMIYFAAFRRQVRTVVSELGSSIGLTLVVLMIIANPIGTVGSVSKLSNDLSIYAFNTIQTPANVVSGSNRTGSEGYAEGLGRVFDSVIVRSWALLEFGNVYWATSPKKLDPEIKDAAKALAADKSDGVKTAVNDAKTNAAVFLAFAPNTAERDGINDIDGKKTLLRVLCDNDDVTKCKGKYKAIADQRTAAGTDARAGQMLLVTTGLICVWIILGLLTVGLLGAAVASVFYLILVAVMAPAAWFNWGGAKRKFQHYLTELAGSLFAKLLYSIGLAIVALLFNVIVSLQLSFFKQWLLMIAAFIFLFRKRKELLGFAPSVLHPGSTGQRAARKVQRKFTNTSRRTMRNIKGDRRDTKRDQLPTSANGDDTRRSRRERRRAAAMAAKAAAAASAKPAASAMISEDPAGAIVDVARRRAVGRAHQANRDLSPMRERLGRLSLQEVESSRRLAELAPGSKEHKRELRRQMSLERRKTRMSRAVDGARRDIERGRDVVSRPVDRAAESARAAKVIDQQAQLPATNRDYRRLAAMADLTPEAYDQLGGRERNQVRSAINHELRAHRSSTPTGGGGAGQFAASATAGPAPASRPARSSSDLNRERVGGKRTRPTPRRPRTQTSG